MKLDPFSPPMKVARRVSILLNALVHKVDDIEDGVYVVARKVRRVRHRISDARYRFDDWRWRLSGGR
jgi:hypothetical protein